MKLKKYIASTLQEGKQRIIRELGEEAVILSTRSLNKVDDNGKTLLEIVAAVDESPIDIPNFSSKQESRQKDILSLSSISKDNPDIATLTNHIMDEIGSLKYILNEISDNIKYKYSDNLGKVYGDIFKNLRKADFSEEYSLNLVGKLAATATKQENFSDALARTKVIITDNIKLQEPLVKGDKLKVAAFIGSTGSGKTTTLVKLAIICKLILEGNVLIVSADTQKIGGADQLQTFASIASIPFQTVYSPEELKSVVEKETARDFIFIDTTGRSQFNKEHLSELGEMIASVDLDYLYLVQSCNISKASLKSVLKEYSILNPNGLVLTKLDEAPSLGIIAEALKDEDIPLSYFTMGQKLPDDIEPATKEKFADLVFAKIKEQIK